MLKNKTNISYKYDQYVFKKSGVCVLIFDYVCVRGCSVA